MTTIPAPRPAGIRAHLARLHPAQNRALRPLIGMRRPHQAALSEEVICQETTRFPPFIHDPENLETAYDAAFAAVDYEKNRLRGWALEDERTVRLRFRNVLATPFGIYPLGDNLYLSGKPSLRKLLTGDLVEHDYGAYAPSRSANTFFGHWLHDALPAAFLAPAGVPIYMNERPDWLHAAQYMERLGLSSLSSDMVFFMEMEAYYDYGMTTDRAGL